MSTEGVLGRVMLIDDEKIDQMMYKRILVRSGMTQDIIGFVYAQDALNYLSDPTSEKIDLILLDINMPSMNGFEFLEAAEQVLNLDDGIPVVMMLTTSLSPDDQKRAAQYSAVKAYANKPLAAQHLDIAATIMCENRQIKSPQHDVQKN